MDVPKIFLTGATGYIGGDALCALVDAHPEWHYTCLVRNSEKGAKVVARYPQIRLVYGDLNSASLIETEACEADVVIHAANADDESSARAIAAGIASRSSPGYWIHTSGAGIFMFPDTDIKSFGNASSKIWDDVVDIASIRALPDHASHRNIEKIVFAAGAGPIVKTAIVCPPCIYGVGRGTDKTRSYQTPELVRHFLERKQAVMVGAGEAVWASVHVHDLSDLYVRLAEDAMKPNGGAASWGVDGYYFADNGEFAWGDLSRQLARRAHVLELLPSAEVVSVEEPEFSAMIGFPLGCALWATNARTRATRARKELGWEPKGEAIEETLDEAIRIEAKSLGLTKGHAAVAAGDA